MNNRRMRTQCVPGPLLSFGRRGLGTRLLKPPDPLRSKAEEVWSGNETSRFAAKLSEASRQRLAYDLDTLYAMYHVHKLAHSKTRCALTIDLDSSDFMGKVSTLYSLNVPVCGALCKLYQNHKPEDPFCLLLTTYL